MSSCTNDGGIALSTMAPLLITPTVGWFFWTVAPRPRPPRRKSADRDGPLGHRVGPAVRAEERRLEQHPPLEGLGVAHRRDRASMRAPGFRKAAMSAVTMTAARFLDLGPARSP